MEVKVVQKGLTHMLIAGQLTPGSFLTPPVVSYKCAG